MDLSLLIFLAYVLVGVFASYFIFRNNIIDDLQISPSNYDVLMTGMCYVMGVFFYPLCLFWLPGLALKWIVNHDRRK